MSEPTPPHRHRSTAAITAGRAASGRALAPALWTTSTWASDGVDDAERRATSMRDGGFYSRYGNPTVNDFEAAIAELEGSESALAFGSGMGAVASVVLALCSAGDHIVAQYQAYAGTLAFLLGPCARLGIETTLVDGTEPGAFAAAVRPGQTMLVMAETPANPRLGLVDLTELGALAGPFTVVDSTFATPMGQSPLEFGVDCVLHSATKGIAGHNDATIGVIAGSAELMEAVWGYSVMHGATASPFDAMNALRGLRTLAVRQRHQALAAQHLALRLAGHPEVRAVHYPGLDSHPQHDLAARQMHNFGTVLSFEVEGGRQRITAMFDALELCRVATSLGGPETLVCHPATSTHVGLGETERAAAGAVDDLVRVSVGLEDPDDIIADLLVGLERRA